MNQSVISFFEHNTKINNKLIDDILNMYIESYNSSIFNYIDWLFPTITKYETNYNCILDYETIMYIKHNKQCMSSFNKNIYLIKDIFNESTIWMSYTNNNVQKIPQILESIITLKNKEISRSIFDSILLRCDSEEFKLSKTEIIKCEHLFN